MLLYARTRNIRNTVTLDHFATRNNPIQRRRYIQSAYTTFSFGIISAIKTLVKQSFSDRVISLIEAAWAKTVAAVNLAMVYTYYEVGRIIVEEEQGGKSGLVTARSF